jgi:hypothetical protein
LVSTLITGSQRQRTAADSGDVLKLRVAVGVIGALQRLAVGLQAVPQAQKPPARRALMHVVADRRQPRGQLGDAAASPAQRRLGVPAHGAVDQPVKGLVKLRVALKDRLPSRARAALAARLDTLPSGDRRDPAAHGRLRDSRRANDGRDPAKAV